MNESSNKTKVNVTGMFFKGTSNTWWMNWVEDLVAGKDVAQIYNGAAMKVTLQVQFGP